jgi:hypothetical protein
LELEKKFFDDNAAIVRENYFDADLLLDVDPAEDLAVEEVVDYDDLVPAISVEEIVWQVAAVDHIASIENEETTERVTSPVVVAAGSGLVDAVGEGRAGAPSDPGPSDGSVRVDDFLPGPRPGPVASMTSSDVGSDEVILISFFDFFAAVLVFNNLCLLLWLTGESLFFFLFIFISLICMSILKVSCSVFLNWVCWTRGNFLASRVTYAFMCASPLCGVPGRYEHILVIVLVWVPGRYAYFG